MILSTTSSARYFDREPTTTSNPDAARRAARPLPAGPVPPSTPICIRTLWSRDRATATHGDTRTRPTPTGPRWHEAQVNQPGTRPDGNQTRSAAPVGQILIHRTGEVGVHLARVAASDASVGGRTDRPRDVPNGQVRPERLQLGPDRAVVQVRHIGPVLVEPECGRDRRRDRRRGERDDPMVDMTAEAGGHEQQLGRRGRPSPPGRLRCSGLLRRCNGSQPLGDLGHQRLVRQVGGLVQQLGRHQRSPTAATPLAICAAVKR